MLLFSLSIHSSTHLFSGFVVIFFFVLQRPPLQPLLNIRKYIERKRDAEKTTTSMEAEPKERQRKFCVGFEIVHINPLLWMILNGNNFNCLPQILTCLFLFPSVVCLAFDCVFCVCTYAYHLSPLFVVLFISFYYYYFFIFPHIVYLFTYFPLLAVRAGFGLKNCVQLF